jgi:acyl-coenzyme A thioesterase PaaI-like protein
MSAPPSSYPPPQHLLRDLRIVLDRTSSTDASLDVTAKIIGGPEITDSGGRVRVGVLATLVDVVAGEMAIRTVLPGWTATSDLSVHVDEVPGEGPIEASARVLRSGRQTVVLEATLRAGIDRREFGVAHVGFAILPPRGDLQSGSHWAAAPAERTEFALPDSGFEKPILDTLGLEFDVESPAITRLPGIPDYLINSLGALQGGAVAILLEAAAERFARATLTGPVRVRSIAIHYLKLGRVGPIRAESRRIARTAGGELVRVTLHDEGADDVLLSVATIQVDEATLVA